ncbi:MAG TPA: AzlC family ABC transporter permease [Clostridiales bacterium]|nr:AzlC family ABC transporter permease [Clostridiales bacterium]
MRHDQARVSGGFSHTLPILAGFLFLGFAYGLLMRTKGFSFLYPMCMAMTIFGGSLEYVTVSMLLSAFAPLETFLMALLIQARHLFYGAVPAGQVRRDGLEEAAAHLWPVRRNLLHHLLR